MLHVSRNRRNGTQAATHHGNAYALRTGVAVAAVIFCGGNASALSSSNDKLMALQSEITAQKASLQREELELEQQALKLDQTQILLDQQMGLLHGRGNSAGTPPPVQTVASTPAPDDATSITGPTPSQQQAKVILQTDSALSNAGGVLTPRGDIVIDPSLEYDYYSQNQLAVNGFTIIPGVTLGNIYIARVQQNIATLALTTRWGITDRLELNLKIPVVAAYGITTTQAVGPDAVALTPSANNVNIGDIQLGASYQFNRDDTGWPIFIGNLLFKTTTGVSPYTVPIFTANDPNGQYLQGIQRKLPTGTGFYALEPSLTILYPTDPGVLFANLQYVRNFGATVDLRSPGGGPSVRTDLKAGDAVAATFGFGFALNANTSMTLSYQQEHVFGASENGTPIKGSAYDFGTFNFGIGYQVNRMTSINLGVGIGAGPNAPVAKILIEVPVKFNVL